MTSREQTKVTQRQHVLLTRLRLLAERESKERWPRFRRKNNQRQYFIETRRTVYIVWKSNLFSFYFSLKFDFVFTWQITVFSKVKWMNGMTVEGWTGHSCHSGQLPWINLVYLLQKCRLWLHKRKRRPEQVRATYQTGLILQFTGTCSSGGKKKIAQMSYENYCQFLPTSVSVKLLQKHVPHAALFSNFN